MLFQHTAARRRLGKDWECFFPNLYVSTHSRPKAAGSALIIISTIIVVSTHSRPKAAGLILDILSLANLVSTHSRPKAAGADR